MSEHNKQEQVIQEHVFPVFWLFDSCSTTPFICISKKDKKYSFCILDLNGVHEGNDVLEI